MIESPPLLFYLSARTGKAQTLPKPIELKLASGLTNPLRLKDIADVQELIRLLKLPFGFANQLDPSVRDKF